MAYEQDQFLAVKNQEVAARPDLYNKFLAVVEQGEAHVDVDVQFLTVLGEGSDGVQWGDPSAITKMKQEGTVTEAELAAGESRLGNFFVKAKAGKAKRCVEDRTDEAWAPWAGMEYGPQIQGGTPDEALAVRITKGVEGATTFDADVSDHIKNHASEFKPGGHVGHHANGEKCDCGAVDHEVNKLNVYANPAAEPYIVNTVTAIFAATNKQIDGTALFANLKQNAAALLQVPGYFANLRNILDVVKAANPEGVINVEGDHSPATLTLNFVHGTTFDPNAYNVETDGKIKNHNLDVWNIFEEYNDQEAFNIIAAALATLTKINDGSLRVFTVTEAAVAASEAA